MNPSDIVSFINKGETEQLEFKSTFQKETITTIVAFANTIGGQILIGIDDSGTINGININPETIQNYINIIKQSTIPAVIPDITMVNIDNTQILVIDVKEYPLKPVSYKGKHYKRVNNSNHLMTPVEISDMYLKVLNLSWDSYEYPDETIESLDTIKVNKFLQKVNETGRFNIEEEPLTILKKLKLIKNNNPTIASILLLPVLKKVISIALAISLNS